MKTWMIVLGAGVLVWYFFLRNQGNPVAGASAWGNIGGRWGYGYSEQTTANGFPLPSGLGQGKANG
jgi:hypothetical protein